MVFGGKGLTFAWASLVDSAELVPAGATDALADAEPLLEAVALELALESADADAEVALSPSAR
ncbi:MAG: hypothetical protein U0271_43065 [Polyangiaceae bacterium]